MNSRTDEATTLRAHVHHARVHLAEIEKALDALAEVAEEVAPDDGPIKVCACGAAYDHVTWATLHLVGQSDDGHEVFESRNCRACNSTISIVIAPSPSR